MRYPLLIIFLLFFVASKSQTWTETKESNFSGPNNYSLYIWDSMPVARMVQDTFFVHDTIPKMKYRQGLIFIEEYNGALYTYEHILKPGETFKSLVHYFRSGLAYGNFAPSALGQDTMLYTALHLIQKNGLVFEDWHKVFDHDDLSIKDYTDEKNLGDSAFLRKASVSSIKEGDTLVMSGWKVYRDALIHVSITGVCVKVPSILAANAPPDFSLIYSYAIRVPDNCAEFIHGLSGSPVYKKSTEELVGIQSHIGKEEFIIEGKETTYVTLIIESL